MVLSTYPSNYKFHLPGMLCVTLAWDMACIELRTSIRLWFSGFSKQGHLWTWSDGILHLASDDFILSRGSRVLLMLLGHLPIPLSAFGLASTDLFFRRLVKGGH